LDRPQPTGKEAGGKGGTRRRPDLPVDRAGPAILAALERAGAAVVVAPPGSGKTTRVPQLLLDAGVLGPGACVVLEPRRVAARAAARRVAEERGSPLGAEVGYQVRFDRRSGDATRLLFVTEPASSSSPRAS